MVLQNESNDLIMIIECNSKTTLVEVLINNFSTQKE